VPLLSERQTVCVASHAHFDHIGCHHEFGQCWIRETEMYILCEPRAEWALADPYASDPMFLRMP